MIEYKFVRMCVAQVMLWWIDSLLNRIIAVNATHPDAIDLIVKRRYWQDIQEGKA